MCVYRNVCDEFIESARMARIRMYSVIYVRYVCLWFLWYWLNKIIISIIYTFIIYSFPHISMLLVFIAVLPLILSWTIFTFADNTHSIPLNRSICFVNLDPPGFPSFLWLSWSAVIAAVRPPPHSIASQLKPIHYFIAISMTKSWWKIKIKIENETQLIACLLIIIKY